MILYDLLRYGPVRSVLGLLGIICCIGVLALPVPAEANPFTGSRSSQSQPADGKSVKVVPSAGEGQHTPDSESRAPARQLQQTQPDGEDRRTGLVQSWRETFAVQYTHFLRSVNQEQRKLRREMSRMARDIKEAPYGASFWLFMGLSFLYGVVHALGPGHGKAIVFAYFLGRKASLWKGFFMGHLLTFVHVLSAVVMVFGLYIVVGQVRTSAMDEAGLILQQVSYGCVTAIGLFMLLHCLYELSGLQKQKRGQPAPASAEAGYRGISSVSFLAGLIPCPGAALVLSFSMSLDIMTAGLISMIAFALGMGLTTAAFGIASIVSRGVLMHVAGKGPRAVRVVYTVCALFGAGAIFLVGGTMFIQSL